jgi:hypothetical protein
MSCNFVQQVPLLACLASSSAERSQQRRHLPPVMQSGIDPLVQLWSCELQSKTPHAGQHAGHDELSEGLAGIRLPSGVFQSLSMLGLVA